MDKTLIIILAVVVLLAVIFIGIYNKLVKLRTRVEEAWSDITIQLKYRADLVPNLVNTVKGYAKHEAETLEAAMKARSGISDSNDIKQIAKAEAQVQAGLRSLYAVAENYPDLKANQNFLELQSQIEDIEHKIQASRRFYNSNVTKYQETKVIFPNNIVANLFGFKDKQFFEVEDRKVIEQAPEVKF